MTRSLDAKVAPARVLARGVYLYRITNSHSGQTLKGKLVILQ